MRKIYSILLIACFMLISANIQAAVWEVNTFDSGSDDNKKLEYAWNNAVTGDIIKLTGDITMTKTLFLGSKTDMEATSKSIVLDINGRLLQGPNGSTNSVDSKAFTIVHGELVLRNSVPGEGSIQARNKGELFFVMGSTLKNCKPQLTPDSIGFVPYYSHVLIEKGVTVTNAHGSGISIDVADDNYLGKIDGVINCNIYGGTGSASGTAFGARVDVYGEINAKKYGIKVNGDVRAPQEYGSGKKYESLNPDATYPGGAKGDYTIYRTDSAYVPFVFVHKGAKLTADANNKESTAIYSSGYARWQIEGECEGSTGVYIKSGIVTVKDATIKSTYLGDYNRPRAKHTTESGIEAGGSGLVVESNTGYSGYTDVTITGDTYVKGGSGYAVDEIVTNDTGTKVDSLKIEGGTIESGSKGAVIIDKKTKDEDKVVVVGGTTQQQVEISDNSTNPPTKVTVQVEDLVPPEGYTSTTIVTPDKTVVVVTPTTGGMAQGNSVALAEEDKYFVWVGTEETLVADKTMSALEINNGVTQVLTIGDATHKVTYTVGRVILGLGAKIIVNPGSKLIVNGAQGLVAEDPSCVLLRANASEQATFVISPDVTSNKQPKATVELYTECYQDGTNSWKWQRFATPMKETATPTKSEATPTGVKYINDATEEWISINAWGELEPFMAAAITNNTNAGGVTYTFAGQVIGNVTDALQRKACKWNYYGNSFMAPMSTAAVLNKLSTNPSMDAVIYYWDFTRQGYNFVNSSMLGDWGVGLEKIDALGFFVLKNKTQEAGALDIDYKNSIFRYAQGLEPEYPAPARARISNADRVRISVTAENGASDAVYVLGSDQYTAEYENGADAEKLMNNGLNVYVQGDMNYAMLATDEILGTTISMQANEAINYTMTFGKVNGDYALRDNMTGKTIAIVEGATYNFSAQPNEVAENRFEIVNRDAVTTDINTIVGDNASKAVYTVLGQYVGETADWNNMPAGIYVVDGVKVVK